MPERPGSGRSAPRAVYLASLAALLLAPGCGTFTQEPELLRRWDRYAVGDTTGLARVTVFTSRSPASDAPSALSGLSRSAQATYVRAVADRTSTAAGLRRALAAPLTVPVEAAVTVDRTVFRRRLVISVERLGPDGAPDGGPSRVARLARTRVALGLRDGRARFTAWDRFVTRWDTVEVGTMVLSRSAELGVDGRLTPGVRIREADEVGLAASLGSTLDESLTLSERHVSNGVLRPDSMILLQEGSAGIDLVGNSAVEVELRLARAATATGHLHRFTALFDPAGAPRPPGVVRVERRRHLYPDRSAVAAGNLSASLRHEALVRTVRRGEGDDTFTESDDHVRFLRDTAPGDPVVLVPVRELRASVWNLVESYGGGTRILQIGPPPGAGPGAVPRALRFETVDDAGRLLRWLDAHRLPSRAAGEARTPAEGPPVTVAGRTLYLAPDRPLRASEIPGLSARLRPLNWSP